jgi:hypothetical protein
MPPLRSTLIFMARSRAFLQPGRWVEGGEAFN